VHRKSKKLRMDYIDTSTGLHLAMNRTFVYTNQGYRSYGTWNRTVHAWQPGACVLEFSRVCESDPAKVKSHSHL
jgi:hypothetical protein